jgi:hypothetical protein
MLIPTESNAEIDLYLVVAAIHTFKLFEISVVDGLRSDGPDFKF